MGIFLLGILDYLKFFSNEGIVGVSVVIEDVNIMGKFFGY